MDGTIAPARANPDVNRSTKRRGPRAQKSLSANDVRILALLRAGPHEARIIADSIGVKRTSIHALLNRLTAKGLVRRRATGWYEMIPPKPIGVEAIAAVTAPPSDSIIRPIPLWRRMAGR